MKHRTIIVAAHQIDETCDRVAEEGWELKAIVHHVLDARYILVFVRESSDAG